MKRMIVDISDIRELEAFARRFAKKVSAPMIILLNGDLGSGKTTFTKFLVRALGCRDDVTSPTYTLLNTYEHTFPIYHFDMYRLSSMEEAQNVGFGEYFDKKTLDGVCLVEWAQNVEGLIKEVDYTIEIKKVGEKSRKLYITGGKI